MNNITTDLYTILRIERSATPQEIRKAYYELAFKYHPDKNKTPGSEEKFKEIQMAYEILSDPQKKLSYDKLPNHQQSQMTSVLSDLYVNDIYNIFKYCCMGFIPNFDKIFDCLIATYGNENNLKKDIAEFNIGNIIQMVLSSTPKIIEQIPSKKNNDISIVIQTQIEEIYADKRIKIKINRQTKERFVRYIQLNRKKLVFVGEGETRNGKTGDLYINIDVEKHERYTLNNHDIIMNHEITLFEFLYGANVIVPFMDDEPIIVELPKMTQQYTIHNKGLPTCNVGLKSVKKSRGDLIINFTIKNINNQNFIDSVKQLS